MGRSSRAMPIPGRSSMGHSTGGMLGIRYALMYPLDAPQIQAPDAFHKALLDGLRGDGQTTGDGGK
jgi:hypothetical protein